MLLLAAHVLNVACCLLSVMWCVVVAVCSALLRCMLQVALCVRWLLLVCCWFIVVVFFLVAWCVLLVVCVLFIV